MVNRFRRNFAGKSTYKCESCGKLTRETGAGEEGCGLCAACFERAGWENHHNDNAHDDNAANRTTPDCLICIEAGYFTKDVPAVIRARFVELAAQLSPENLSCDGELPASQIRARAAAITREWKQLEKQVGRKVTEDETWKWGNTPNGTGTASPKTKEDPMANKTTGNATKAKTEVAKLVKKLEALEDKSNAEGRAIRRMLRKLGHMGGTRKPRKAAKKTKK